MYIKIMSSVLGYFSFFVFSLILFMVGIHNIDNAWNMNIVNEEFDTVLVDYTVSGDFYTADQLYVMGFALVQFAAFLISISTWMLSSSLSDFRHGKTENQKSRSNNKSINQQRYRREQKVDSKIQE